MKMYRLYEIKTNQLKKLYLNGNITEEQFNAADEFFKTHSDYEKEIDWNKGLKITWDDLEKVISKERNTKSQVRSKIRKGLEGFKEGKDYTILEEGIYDGEPWVAYQPFTWEASRMIASHYVEPSRNKKGEISDAEWCTAYQKNRVFWDKHDKIEAFIYICGETIPTKKVAISISNQKYDASGSKFLYYLGNLNYNIWNFKDYYGAIEEENLIKVVPKLNYLIKKAYKNWNDRTKKQLLSKLKLNPQTNRYDYEGNLSNKDLNCFVSEDKDGFIINFGEIIGSFDCSELELKSLKGSPHIVKGDFDCYENQLTSLKGAPQTIGGSFYCYKNHLTSLEGAPQTVGVNFNCILNWLTSLKGAPHIVGGYFDCHGNQITSLEGAPHIVGSDFNCYKNNLTSLEGSPREVGGDFCCERNPNLQSLKGIGSVRGKIKSDL